MEQLWKKLPLCCERILFCKKFISGQTNTENGLFVAIEKKCVPPFHIRLGLMKNSAKVINRNGECSRYLAQKFPWINDAEIKGGVLK
jgi:hypothetical protein